MAPAFFRSVYRSALPSMSACVVGGVAAVDVVVVVVDNVDDVDVVVIVVAWLCCFVDVLLFHCYCSCFFFWFFKLFYFVLQAVPCGAFNVAAIACLAAVATCCWWFCCWLF